MAMPFVEVYTNEDNGLHTGRVRVLVNTSLYNSLTTTSEIIASGTCETPEECFQAINRTIFGMSIPGDNINITPIPVLATCNNTNASDVSIWDYFDYLTDGIARARESFAKVLGVIGKTLNTYNNTYYKVGFGSVSDRIDNDISSTRKIGMYADYWSSAKDDCDFGQNVSLGSTNYNSSLLLARVLMSYGWHNTKNVYQLINYTNMWRILPSTSFNEYGQMIADSTEVGHIQTSVVANDASSSLGYDWSVQGSKRYYGTLTTESWINTYEFGNVFTIGISDPLSSGGYSESSEYNIPTDIVGGNGEFYVQDDDIPRSDLPNATMSLIGAGSGLAYVDDGTQVNALMRYMWTHADDIVTNLKKIIANPIDSILGLHIIPVAPSYGTPTEVYLGNVGTNIRMNPVLTPYRRFIMGQIHVPKYWGSALDHNPFTEVSIYLPYIGFRRLNVDEVIGADLTLYYDIDVLSGACVAHLEVTRKDALTGEVHTSDSYNWNGNCAMQIPVTSNNYQGVYSTIASALISVAGGMAAGAAGVEAGLGYGAYATGLGQSLSTTANHIMNGGSKIRVEKEGSIGGAHGFLASQYAFIERTTPRQSLAPTYKQVMGYPSNTSMVLGTCQGFTQVEDINLENFSCTGDEKNELELLLKGGVIF